MTPTKCGSCPALVVWTTAGRTGKRVALVADTADGGCVVYRHPRRKGDLPSPVVLAHGSVAWFYPEDFVAHVCLPNRPR